MSEYLTQAELDRLFGSESTGVEAMRSSGGTCNKNKLHLILDVPVNCKVIAGKTQKNLGELLALKPGMIVETDNSISEFVELCVNDNVIALGEVVIVGENYGLRVKQIVTPLERVCKLK